MKTFSIHTVRNALAVVIIAGIAYGAYVANPDTFNSPKAEAGTSENISGWVWSDTVGWISLNSTNETTGSSYGVSVDVTNKSTGGTGGFSGTAWSMGADLDGGIGWISFDRTITSNPPSAPFNTGSGPIAQVDWATGKVTGWARALTGCEVTPGTPVTSCASSSAGAAAGGWDGWIKLSDDSVSVWSGNGVKILGNKFSGYAWGGADSAGSPGVIGWIDFGPTIAGISIGGQVAAPPCVATDPTIVWGACQAVSECPATSMSGVRVGVCASGGTVVGSCTLGTAACTGGTTGGGGSGGGTGTKWWQF
ncbi:MAG: hypothetical protein HZB10_02595 [Candidatus Yonathbacteria bacterium]|nr:hypothetical protein [Candidatus Yonathbacteria bacterium]